MYLGLTLSGESTYFGKLNFPTLDVYDKTKVVNSKEVREVQEGATCFCDRKLSKIG